VSRRSRSQPDPGKKRSIASFQTATKALPGWDDVIADLLAQAKEARP